MTENDERRIAAVRRVGLLLGKMPSWMSNALLAIVIVTLYLFGVIFVLPRLGFET